MSMLSQNSPDSSMATKRAKKTDIVSPSSAELRKAVEAIAIQPKSGKITLLTRKLFNVLLAVAQQADESGDTYRALLSDIVANSAFDSNDTALVKEHLRRMVSVQVEWSTGTSSQKPGRKWGISTLIADAEILEDPATRRVWVEFSFAPKIKKKLLDPVQYARLSLQFQSQLRSSAGLALYEICVRYLTNPSHLPMRETWEWWRPILSGTPDTEAGDEAKREYKYFKRDYLRPAIAEVNAVTNIFVELIEHREGRRVAEIQFRVTERKQPMLALDEHPNVFDSTLVDRMVKIGIPLKDAQTLYADSEENRIRAALQMTEQRMRSTSLPPVRSAAALFRLHNCRARSRNRRSTNQISCDYPPRSTHSRCATHDWRKWLIFAISAGLLTRRLLRNAACRSVRCGATLKRRASVIPAPPAPLHARRRSRQRRR